MEMRRTLRGGSMELSEEAVRKRFELAMAPQSKAEQARTAAAGYENRQQRRARERAEAKARARGSVAVGLTRGQ